MVFYYTILQCICVSVGEHLYRTGLKYKPGWQHVVCGFGVEHICVAEESPVLHIHSISSGEEVRRIVLEDVLENESEVRAVAGSEDGKSVTVVVGDRYIHSILLYQVKSITCVLIPLKQSFIFLT